MKLSVLILKVRQLRDRSGACLSDCRRAIEATEGNVDKAVDQLRAWGIEIKPLDKRHRHVTAGR